MGSSKPEYEKDCPLCGRRFQNFGAYIRHFGVDHDQPPWREESVLREFYVDRKMPIQAIAEKFGCADSTITKWMKKHSIEARTAAECWEHTEHPHTDGRYNTPEELQHAGWLREKYHTECKSIRSISDELGCQPKTVSDWMDKHDIEKRQAVDALREKLTPGELRDENWLRKEYVENGKAAKQIAEEIGCSFPTVCKWVNRHGIEQRNYRSGGEHPHYKGTDGISYGPGWQALAAEIRERDDNECQECLMSAEEHQQEYGLNLHVHHKTPIVEFEEDGEINHREANRPENLITLCLLCHQRVEKSDNISPGVAGD